ncbi:amino acid adenylation domain-containing protein [Hymenobacter sp. HSC-4F20]|uniref:non-ribosomal peptide synthetase n=1 Tax=Hymenobacter sp. HSC-4F20 TaxID=2864135 RepID=UPI001C736021|nr:non-ribosomal peptide synthetase [Hymenobacter sp. HSC-4F20]MBX0293008.1 amino acid adenylation domain-containing protein [Hymenobacter sp. HSC-4F20]
MKPLVYKQFEDIAAQNPTAEALRFGARHLSYAELNEQANRIAALLTAVEPEPAIIKVLVPASPELVAALLGVFKAGHVYLPVDLHFAEQRLQQIFEETPAASVLVHRAWLPEWEALAVRVGLEAGKLLILDENEGITVVEQGRQVHHAWAELPAANPATEQDPEDANYLFYTSGSTGKAKAIVGMHKSLAHFIEWEAKEFAAGPGLRVSQLIQFTFDASLRDIFLPLCTGGTLCIPEAETRGNLTQLVEWIDAEQIQLLHGVPSLFQQLTKTAQQHENKQLFRALQYVLLAGEPLYAKDLHRWREVFGEGIEVVNLYGATETTMIKTFHRITEVPAAPGQILSVGKPIDNTFILVLNQGKLCRIGEIGEVYIKTPFITKGYYNNPALTRQVFVQNPLIQDRTDIIYKTGDLGRYAPDRSLEILGRQDRQVKINGVRIELNEIEEALLAVAEVEEAVAKTIKDAEGKLQLVCYYTAPAPIADLREQLMTRLNAYMLPSFLVHMLEFPLNSNGKIDKAALPSPEEVLLGSEFDLPQEGLETTLANIWKAELGLKAISRDLSFYHMGGNSLKAMKIAGDIQQQLNVELKLMDIFVYPTIAKLAAFIAEKVPTEAGHPLLPAPKMASYPLTHTQKRLWVISNLETASVAYHMPITYALSGAVNAEALSAAFQAVLARHESLRTVFRPVEDDVRQVVLPWQPGLFTLQQETVPATAGSAEEAVREQVQHFQQLPFDLVNELPIRAKLLVVSPTESVLVTVVHHIVFDGWSTSLLLQELTASYQALAAGQPLPVLPELPVQYKDYAVWQQQQLKTPAMQASEAFWKAQFATEVPVLELPLDKPRPLLRSYAGRLQEHLIPRATLEQFRALCLGEHGTLFNGLTAAVNVLLHRYSGQTDIVVGTPVANREKAEIQSVIGFFANTVALRNTFSAQDTFQQLLARVKHTTTQALQHAAYPFDRLVEQLPAARELSRSPLFDVALILHKAEVEAQEGAAPATEAREAAELTGHSKFDLTFSFREVAEGLLLKLEYNTDLFTAARVARIAGHVEELLHQAAAAPSTTIQALRFIPAPEQELLRRFSHEDLLQPLPSGEGSLVRLFKQQAALYPTKAAVQAVVNGTQLTYQELDEQSDYLAAYLVHQAGVEAGAKIGISTPRNQWAVVAMLGVLKAGAVYVFLEPSLPAQRLRYICEHAALPLVLSSGPALAVPAGVATLALEDAVQPNAYPLPDATASDLAYLCYTSGSTGVPKGVLIRQNAVVNMVDSVPGVVITPQDCLLNVCSFAFDGSVFDLYGALLKGATVVLMDETQAKDLYAYEAAVMRYAITVAFLPTALFNVLMDVGFPGFGQLRHVLIGGEAASGKHLRAFTEQFGAGRLLNMYGPTENTVYATAYPVAADAPYLTPPIGQPTRNVVAYLRDAHGMPVPVGVVGELWLAGAGLAQEYYRNEQLNQERFGLDALTQRRVYRTGDLCKWSEDGQLLFTGRKDDMLKIRGFLVEVEEIVAAALAHPAVKEAAVLYQEVEGVPALVLYLVPAQELADQALLTFLGQRVPGYMVPQYVVRVAAMPLNHNGKVDRPALAALPLGPLAAGPAVAAESAAEKLLEACWQVLLKKDELSATSNFYALGGDSIKLIQLVSMLRQQGYRLNIKDFMEEPTIAGAATKLVAVLPEEAAVEYTGQAGLSAIQLRYVDLVAEPYLHHFNQSVKLIRPAGFAAEAVQTILQHLVAHHEGLRAQFRKTEQGQWQQVVPAESPRLTVPVIDLRLEADPETAFARQATALQQSMSLERGELLKAAIFRQPGEDVLLLAVHHLVVDGVSWRILFEDFGVLYAQYEAGSPLALPAPSTALLRAATWQATYAHSAALGEEQSYWQQVASQPQAALPVGQPQGTNLVSDSATVSFKIEARHTAVLQTAAAQLTQLEVHDVLLAALGLACHQHFGMHNVPVHLEGHGREEVNGAPDLSRVVGWFTSIFPVVLPAPGPQGVLAYAQQVRRQLRAVPHKGLGYGILKYVAQDPVLTQAPQPAICFNYLGQFDSHIATQQAEDIRLALGEKGREVHPLMPRFHEIEFSGLLSEEELHLSLQYSQARFGRAEIEALAARFSEAVAALVDAVTQHSQQQLLPLSYTQQNFFSPYRVVGEYSEIGPVPCPAFNQPALEAALRELQQRHDALQTTFVLHDGVPYRQLQPPAPLALEWVDCRMEPATRRPTLLREAQHAARQQVTLQRPWAVRVLRFEDEDELLIVLSHLIFDGYSQGVLQAELTELYQAALAGTLAPSPAPAAPAYQAFVEAQQAYVAGPEGAQALSYWKKQLAGANLAARPAAPHAIKVSTFVQGSALLDFEQWLDSQRVMPLAALLGLCRRVYHHLSGQEDVAVAVPVSLRAHNLYHTLDNRQAIGFYSNIVLNRGAWSSQDSLATQLNQVQDSLAADFGQHQYPYDKLLHELQAEPGFFPEVGINYQNYSSLKQAAIDISAQPAPQVLPGECRAAWWLDVFHFGNALQLNMLFHPGQFSAEQAQQVADLFTAELKHAVQAACAPVLS